MSQLFSRRHLGCGWRSNGDTLNTNQKRNRSVGPVNFDSFGIGMSFVVFCASVWEVRSRQVKKARQIIRPTVPQCVISAICRSPTGNGEHLITTPVRGVRFVPDHFRSHTFGMIMRSSLSQCWILEMNWKWTKLHYLILFLLIVELFPNKIKRNTRDVHRPFYWPVLESGCVKFVFQIISRKNVAVQI